MLIAVFVLKTAQVYVICDIIMILPQRHHDVLFATEQRVAMLIDSLFLIHFSVLSTPLQTFYVVFAVFYNFINVTCISPQISRSSIARKWFCFECQSPSETLPLLKFPWRPSKKQIPNFLVLCLFPKRSTKQERAPMLAFCGVSFPTGIVQMIRLCQTTESSIIVIQ